MVKDMAPANVLAKETQGLEPLESQIVLQNVLQGMRQDSKRKRQSAKEKADQFLKDFGIPAPESEKRKKTQMTLKRRNSNWKNIQRKNKPGLWYRYTNNPQRI